MSAEAPDKQNGTSETDPAACTPTVPGEDPVELTGPGKTEDVSERLDKVL